MAGGLDGLPMAAGGGERLLVIAVEDDDEALITRNLRRQRRPFDEEADRRPVRVRMGQREDHGLVGGVRLLVGRVGEEALVREGPEVVVERGEPLGRRRLHDRPPAAPERLLDQRRQHRLERLALEVVEMDFRHGAQIAPKSPPLPLPDENRATGFDSSRRDGPIGPRGAGPPSSGKSSAFSGSGLPARLAASLRSQPAQKAPPAPQKTATDVSGSRSKARNASVSASAPLRA